jgi:hypothetical protein
MNRYTIVSVLQYSSTRLILETRAPLFSCCPLTFPPGLSKRRTGSDFYSQNLNLLSEAGNRVHLDIDGSYFSGSTFNFEALVSAPAGAFV